MLNFFKLIRYQNLLLLAFMQLIFRYGFLKYQDIWLSLSDLQYGLLVFSTVLLAAGGYVVNDIFDQDTDAENKPNKWTGLLFSLAYLTTVSRSPSSILGIPQH